ncbi:uncharacterized protein VTP21DRAFT_6068 [Calcarisporiella thermophila]|uniref:uncharacterized protein n=1 Tax=Calcarisporiella thermophila TaxID=911321 RepID=UPI0037427696
MKALKRYYFVNISIDNLKNIVFYVIISRLTRWILIRIWRRGLVGFTLDIWKSIVKRAFGLFCRIPPVRRYISQKLAVPLEEIVKSVAPKNHGTTRQLSLPPIGLSDTQVLYRLTEYSKLGRDVSESLRQGKVSGAVYHGGEELADLCTQAYRMFAFSNPLHAELFPGVNKMEAEIVSMCLHIFNAPKEDGCGTTTSGGTESILMAVKAYRDKAREERGIVEPEIIIPETAHAAFNKACAYFCVKPVIAPLDSKNYKVDVKAVKRLINGNTVMIVGSAPNFPHGIIDDIPQLAALAKKYGIGMHVDCCLGGFVVPFLDRAGFPTEPTDFRVPGVTSISCDTHKYGFAPKGSSVILYSSRAIRQYQYFCEPDWIGGVYASPTMAGSRPGALIAGCWAALMRTGEQGYIDATRKMVKSARIIKEGINNTEGLFVLGDPKTTVIAFSVKDDPLLVFAIASRLSKEHGYYLTLMQNPPAAHIACTLLTTEEAAENFLIDIRNAMHWVRQHPEIRCQNFEAVLYGTTASLPDKSFLREGSATFLDALYMA